MHIQLAHSCRNVLLNALMKRFANITSFVIMDYLVLCEECQKKRSITMKHVVIKPIISNDLNSRCQMDLIDMQSQPDRDFRFVLVYQDHLTKFTQLRPLKTKRAEEVAYALVQIFSIFGAPHILHTDNGREYENKIVKEILTLWPGCKLVHGKPHHSQTQGSVERANRDVEDKLKCWMGENATAKWSEGLPFVQFAKNRCLHSGIGRSPYKAMFGIEPKVGLSTIIISSAVIEKIDTEDDLERVLAGRKEAAVISDASSMHAPAVDSDGVDPAVDSDGVDDIANNHNNGGNAKDNEVNSSDTDDNEILVCVVCEMPCQGTHSCLICKLPCHIICGIGDESDEGYGSKVTCFICGRGESANGERRGAKRKMIVQADKMKQASDKRFKVAEVGNSVRVPIPELDRGRADHRNLIGVVMEVNDGFYKIGMKYGALKCLYTRGQFELCSEQFLAIDEVAQKEISVREASTHASIGTGQGFKKCSCITKCDSNRCTCRKNGKLCNSKCHGSNSCANK